MKKSIIIIVLGFMAFVLFVVIGGYTLFKFRHTVGNGPVSVKTSSIKTSGSKEIIFGENLNFGSNVISSNLKLNNMIMEKFKENGISMDIWNDLSDETNKKVQDIIENNGKMADIKKITNVKYSVYSIDKKIGEFYGKYSNGMRSYHVEFSDKNANGLFINGDYNHMPRSVEVYVNITDNKDGGYIVNKYKEYDEKLLNEVGKRILGNDQLVDIAQLFKCDINGDGSKEVLVNFNNALTDWNTIMNKYTDFKPGDYDKYYGVIAILDEEYNIIDFIQDRRHFVINSLTDYADRYGEMFTRMGYICDVDYDNEMEVISYLHAWEAWGFRISKLNSDMVFSKDVWFVQ